MLTIPGISIQAQIYESYNSLVYRGIREQDCQPVILKALKHEYPTPTELARYRTEYEITKSLDLAGVIKVYELQKYQNTLVMLVEDFQGESLNIWIKQQQFSLEQFLQIAINTADILGQIHAANIIHKDINPSNIIFNSKNGQLKIIDFGISTKLTRENPSLKNPTMLEGTLAYMSPEQTGRMNRALDYRSDFYSLGATFYELLTGKLPFDTTDALQLVHCHIAKQPLPPSNLNSKIPQVISDIVMKLLAKTAEERYQNAFGIKSDLEKCLQQLHNHGEILHFSVASQDISNKFQIPQKLYGREQEIELLITAFERVSVSNSEMMLISGYSGIGKSVLVQEIYKPITAKRGYFISGKFDQYQRNIPYSAVVNAFGKLVKQLLTESEAQLKSWREKILASLGVNGQVIIDVIPDIELIIGNQPAVTALSATEAQNRFNLVFQDFIKIFTHPHHPLVIFLDDLQWADSASLKLMQLSMSTNAPGMFLIGAYRANEVSSAHPLMLTINEITKTGAIVNQIFLSPLGLPVVTHLISDTLNCTSEIATPLAELILLKTGGNPFFMSEFLKSLYAEKLLDFDFKKLVWQWNLEQIQARGFTDNVVEMMAAKIQKLPENTQFLLKVAACIGNQFDLKILELISNQSLQETIKELYAAVIENLVLPLSNIRELELAISEEALGFQLPTVNLTPLEFKFSHDRIQQAAYTLIPEETKQTIHRQIGQLLLQDTPKNRLEEKIFDIVNQLNFGSKLITNSLEKEELAQLNLEAGKKAKATAAYESAYNYLQLGIEFLGESGWLNHYHLTLSLHQEATEAAYLSGNFLQMERLVQIVLNNAVTALEKVRVIEVKILALISESKLEQALDIGRQILKQLGVELPIFPNNFNVLIGLLKTKLALAGKKITDLADLPQMRDPYKEAAVRILSKIIAPAYFAAPKLVPLIVCQQVTLFIKYGNSVESIYSYAIYGMILCGVVGDIDSGYAFGELVLRLLEQLNAKEYKAKGLLSVNDFIWHWKKPAQETLLPVLEAYKSGLETGDFEFVGYAAIIYCYHSFLVGVELSTLAVQIKAYAEVMQQLKQEQTLRTQRMFSQLVLNLLGQAENPCDLIGDAYNEKMMLPLHIQDQERNAIFLFYLNKLICCYLFGQYSDAVLNATQIEQYLDSATGMYAFTYFYFYGSLARLAFSFNSSKQNQKRCLALVAANQKKMKKWANHAPENFLHKFYLVEAERCRFVGKDVEAMEYYDHAIALAKKYEYVNETALAYELTAKFYLERGKELIAKVYMQESRYYYQLWGAIAKVKDLDTRYPQLLQRANALKLDSQVTQTSTCLTAADYGSSLDLSTVIKASQALSSEIVLEKLLSALMQILIENAGAQKGFLILPQNGRLVIAASTWVDTDKGVVQGFTPIESSQDLPITVINYVDRTHNDVVLSNAAVEGKFISDSYISLNKLKSVLCTPILNQGKLVAILYLENNLTSDAFTADRLEILRVLSSQAAISLENALLYASLEQKVQDRTQQLNEKNIHLEQTLHELKYTQAQLIQAEKMSGLGQMVAGIAHEINNPINFIYGNLSYANQYVQDLLKLINIYQKEYPNPTQTIQDFIEDIDLSFLVPDLQKLLTSMQDGANRISNIVLGLRTFSRLDESAKKAVDINEGIDSALLILQHRLQERKGKQEIEVIKEYGKLPLATCYASQLNQVFMNILNNAIDAIEELESKQKLGSEKANSGFVPCIHISTELTASEFIKVIIADNGIGITEEVLPNIFNPFFTTKPVGSGTGLGLSVSYQIVVDAHSGKLSCVSVPLQGSKFVIEIPINS